MALIAFLVEDNKMIRDNLIPTIEDLTQAHVLGFAETERDASDWLGAHRGEWDVAVVDLFLREGSGLGVLEGCQARQPHQRVVIFSNYATSDIKERAEALGADAVFDKSTDVEGLVLFLESLDASRASPAASA